MIPQPGLWVRTRVVFTGYNERCLGRLVASYAGSGLWRVDTLLNEAIVEVLRWPPALEGTWPTPREEEQWLLALLCSS